MRWRCATSIIFVGFILLLILNGRAQPAPGGKPLTPQQITLARQIGGYGLRNCGVITIQPEGYHKFVESDLLPLNTCSIRRLKNKKPFLLIYKSAREDFVPPWCMIGTAKGQVYTLGLPLHDEAWDGLREIQCKKYKVKSISGRKYLQCG